MIVIVLAIYFARTKQTARKGATGGGKAPKRSLAERAQRQGASTASTTASMPASISASTSTSISTSMSAFTSISPSTPTSQAIPGPDDPFWQPVIPYNTNPIPTSSTVTDDHQHEGIRFSTRNIKNEVLKIPHREPSSLAPCGSVHLRPPDSDDSLWSRDIVYCSVTAPLFYPDVLEPNQPQHDMLCYFPLIGECSFIGFEPYRFTYNEKLSQWYLYDEAKIGMIVELKSCTWSCNLPCRLLIDIGNMVQVIGRQSIWRDDLTYFALLHHLKHASPTSSLVPSLLYQHPNCPHLAYHYSSDHPMYGICLDHWIQLIDRPDKLMQTLPLPFKLEAALQRLVTNSSTTTATSTSSLSTTCQFRRVDRRLICQLITGMVGLKECARDDDLLHRIAAHHLTSAGNCVKLYAMNSKKKQLRKEFDALMDTVGNEIGRICFEDDSRFFSSPLLVYMICISIHANGQGSFTICGNGNKSSGTIDVEQFGKYLLSIITRLPPIINCPIIIYLGSCAHNLRTFDTWYDAISIQHSSAASHLYFIYFDCNALIDQLYMMCRSFIDLIMINDNTTVESAFWDAAINPDYAQLAPRLRCPDGTVYMPHHQVSVSRDIIDEKRQRHNAPSSSCITITLPTVEPVTVPPPTTTTTVQPPPPPPILHPPPPPPPPPPLRLQPSVAGPVFNIHINVSPPLHSHPYPPHSLQQPWISQSPHVHVQPPRQSLSTTSTTTTTAFSAPQSYSQSPHVHVQPRKSPSTTSTTTTTAFSTPQSYSHHARVATPRLPHVKPKPDKREREQRRQQRRDLHMAPAHNRFQPY